MRKMIQASLKASVFAGTLLGTALAPVLASAQGLPDEINHAPYYSEYISIRSQRDQVDSSLSAQRQSLSNILAAISDKTNYIETLDNQIYEFTKRIGFLEREIPEKRRDLQDTQYDLSRVEQSIVSMQNQLTRSETQMRMEQSSLNPIQRKLRRLAQDISQESRKAQALRKKARTLRGEMDKASKEVANLKKQNQKIAQEIKTLQQSESTLKGQVSTLDRQLKVEQANLKKIETQATQTSAKIKNLLSKLNQEKRKLGELRRSGADAGAIAAQQKKVSVAQANYANANKQLRALQTKRAQASKKVQSASSKLVAAKNKLKAIPGKIAASQNKRRANGEKIKKNEAVITTNRPKLEQAQRQVQEMDRALSQLQRRHARLQADENEIQARINGINSQIRRLEGDIVRESATERDIRNQIILIRDEIQNMEEEIPALDRNIAYNKAEISSAQAQISSHRHEEDQTRGLISSLESELRGLSSQTDLAYGEYEKRQNLYNKHLKASQELGASQTAPAISLGDDKGLEKAQASSSELAQSFGSDEGRAQATLIGFVRGENQGYSEGYELGVNSLGSMEEGSLKGSEAGKSAAYNFVRTNLKPGYFEKHMLELLKMPVGFRRKAAPSSIGLFKSARKFSNNGDRIETFSAPQFASIDSFDLNSSQIPGLENQELRNSRSNATAIDARIEEALKDVSKLQARFEEYQNPTLAYEQPGHIPYTQVNCGQVYKGVAEYARACEENFRKVFSQKYLRSVESSFTKAYPELFVGKYEGAESSSRESYYQERFDTAHAVALAQGEKDGKKDAFDQAYKFAYDEAYSENLEPAKTVADQEAQREGHDWISKNPVLTGSSVKISSSNLRGGSKGELLVSLKNIGAMKSLSSGSLRIKGAKNLRFSQRVFKLGAVDAKSVKTFSFPFTVDSSARSGEKIEVSASLELPGDKYRSIREEQVSASESLVVNPKYGMGLEFDPSPRIKGVFSYYVHQFSANIKPIVEDLDANYEVVLSVDSSQSSLMNFKVSKLQTKVLRVNQESKLNFSYVFNRSAKGKTVNLKLEVFYKGASVGSQNIQLRPH